MNVDILLWPRVEVDVEKSGGAERVALYDVEYLNKYGIQSRLFVKKVNKQYRHIRALGHLDFLGTGDYLYHLHFILSSRSDLYLAINCPKLSLLHPTKTILSFHINDPWLPHYTNKIFRNRYKKSFFVFCSNFLKKEFLRKYPEIPESRCFICYNGVDTSRFRPMREDSDGAVRILFLGQWIEEKGIYVLLEAIKKLSKKRKDFVLLLGGGPYLWKVNTLRDHQKKIEEKVKKIVGSIKCIKIIGIIDYSRLPELYNSVDIVIFPSIDQEAFGLVNTEAMACGLPVVATDVGGVPEVIVNNETGLLVEPSNAKALTNALEYLIDNEPIRKKMGRKGRERVERYFTLDIHTENLIKIFNHVLMERI